MAKKTDIWAWVHERDRTLRKAGQTRVTSLIWSLPHDENQHRAERVIATLPEAVSAARALEDPWLEVYFRHWGMQNRINNVSEGSSALPEATALLEFAHREATKDCPQSICVTQDMAIAYGNTDGPGYAQERLDVVTETIARIDPSWQCFTCLTIEYANALEDEGKHADATAYMNRQADALEQAGQEVNTRFRWRQAAILSRSGKAEEAVRQFDILDALKDVAAQDDRVRRAIERSLALVMLGSVDEAHEKLPKWNDLTPGDYAIWTEVLKGIIDAKPELNTWQIGSAFQSALDHMVKVGAHRRAMDIALRHGELSIARGARMTANRALDTAQSLVPQLHAPLDAPARVLALADAVAGMPDLTPTPVPASELLAFLRATDSQDLEQQLEWLTSASRERPDDIELHLATAAGMGAMRLNAAAIGFLFGDLEAQGVDRRIVNGILGLAHDGGSDETYSRLVTLVEPQDAVLGHLVRGVWAYARENWLEAMSQAAAVLETNPDDREALGLSAGSAMKARDFGQAALAWKHGLDLDGGELKPGQGWNLIAAASACQDWSLVREIAAKMGMTLTGETGLVEENWETCVIVFDDEGSERRYGAQRTGPVTARIIQPAQAGRPQHAGDWVVFDAKPVDPPPADEEARKRFWYTYRVVHVIADGEFGDTWLLDGASPDGDQWAQLRDGIRKKGWTCWNVTGPNYRVVDPSGSAKGLPGILVVVAAPRSTRPAEIHDSLNKMTKKWKHPASWLELAKAAGKDVNKHKSIVDRYRL